MSIIAISGSKGQLGSEIEFCSEYAPQHQFIFFDSDELDLKNETKMNEVLTHFDIDFLVNCAAYTKVDLAESEQFEAFQINEKGTASLARICHEQNINLIHISSDYVYDPPNTLPINELTATTPQSVYGASKLAGDQKILELCSHSVIIRTSWLYSSFGNNFLKTMLHLAQTKETIQVVFDQIGCPTYARDLASSIIRIIDHFETLDSQKNELFGIYNVSNAGCASWFDFAKAIFEYSQLKINVIPIRSVDFLKVAPRPYFSLFDQTKFNNTFGKPLPYWRDSVLKCIKALNRQ